MAPATPPAIFSLPVPLETETSRRYRPTVPSDVTARRVHRARRQRVGRDEVPAALLGHADEALLAGLLQRVAEGRVVVLERAHLLELLLHAPPPLHRELEDLGELLLRHLAVRDR